MAVAELSCPAGWHCSGGAKENCTTLGTYCPMQSTAPVACPAGSYCHTPAEIKICNAGQYCAESATEKPRQCAAGHYCATPASEEVCEAGTFCEEGSELPTGVSVGHFSANAANEDVSIMAAKEVLCPAGSYCSKGSIIPCNGPAFEGKLCKEGSNAPADCTAGFYCPTSDRQDACETGFYCPKGSWNLTLSKCPEGATCTVPASPELIIEFDAALERRESEVTTDNALEQLTGEIQYDLSLSVQPRMDVEVKVELQKDDNGTTAICVVHDHGLSLNGATEFTFNKTNWNVPQAVQIAVRRKRATYQGNTVTRFAHSVTSEDPDWQAPFLRPMTVAISDDDECTEGAQKYDALVTFEGAQKDECDDEEECYTIRKCGCSEGYFIEDTDRDYCDSVTTCAECSPGMVCSATSGEGNWLSVDSRLEKLVLDPGYFRISENVTSVIECPVEDACTTNSTTVIRTAGDALCDSNLGHEGPLCMVCHTGQNETWYWEGQKCVLCEGEEQNAVIFFSVMSGTALFLLLDAFFVGLVGKMVKCVRNAGSAQLKQRCPQVVSWWKKQKEAMEEFTIRFQTKYKILVNFVQILNKVTTLYPISLPATFESVWHTLDSLNPFILDLNAVPLSCIWSNDFHSRLVMMTLGPIGFLIFIAFTYVGRRQLFGSDGAWEAHKKKENWDKDEEAALKAWKEQEEVRKKAWYSTCIRVAILFLLTVFPAVSTTVFQTFGYDERLGDGESYLKADYTIKYGDPTHTFFRYYALVFMVVYCLGIPLGTLLVLNYHKKDIQKLQLIRHSLINLDNLPGLSKEEVVAKQKKDAVDAGKKEGTKVVKDLVAGDGPQFGGGVTNFNPQLQAATEMDPKAAVETLETAVVEGYNQLELEGDTNDACEDMNDEFDVWDAVRAAAAATMAKLIVEAKPKLEPYLNDAGLEWADILPMLNAIDSPEKLQLAMTNLDDFLANLVKTSSPAAMKLLMVMLKPKLEPVLKKEGLEWVDILPVLQAVDSVEKLQSAIKQPEQFLADLASISGPAAMKLFVVKLKPKLEPLVKKKGLEWADVLSMLHAVDSMDTSQSALDNLEVFLLDLAKSFWTGRNEVPGDHAQAKVGGQTPGGSGLG
jgi:hypothetical protein